MGFSRLEYCSGLPYTPPGDLSDPGIEPVSLEPILAGEFLTSSTTWEAQEYLECGIKNLLIIGGLRKL